RHGLGSGIAALARHDRRQYRQRHHFLQLPLEQAKHRRSEKGGRKVHQQPVEAPARHEPHRIRSSSSRPTPPRARISSSSACSITSVMSSSVLPPTTLSLSSTTGAATRS